MNSGKVLLGVLAGAAVGTALGLLFAPAKGSVSRRQISRKSGDFWEDLKCKIEDLVESAKEGFNDVKDDAEDLYAKGKDEAEDLYAKGKEKVQEAKHDFKTNNANVHL